MLDGVKAIGTFATTVASATGGSSIVVATITRSAPGILGYIGLSTTTTVALPVTGVVAVAGLVGYGIYKGVQIAKGHE